MGEGEELRDRIRRVIRGTGPTRDDTRRHAEDILNRHRPNANGTCMACQMLWPCVDLYALARAWRVHT